MVESVRKYGVLVPALVRPKEDDGYEMVAGHRRKFATALTELTEIPCIVRNLTDDEATICNHRKGYDYEIIPKNR